MESLLGFIVIIIGGLIAMNVRYYISIHTNNSFSSREKKVYFITGNAFVIVIGIIFAILNAKN